MKIDCSQSEFQSLLNTVTSNMERASRAETNALNLEDKLYKKESEYERERGKLQAEIDALKLKEGKTSYGEDNAIIVGRLLVSLARDEKINAIKEVRQLTGLGLKEAKDLVEAACQYIDGRISAAKSKTG